MRSLALIALLVIAAPPGAAQVRKEVTIWTARAITTVLAEVGSEFERTSGYRLNVTTGLSSDFARRVAAGEQFDVIVSGLGVVDQFVREGKFDATTRTVIAGSGIGIEVRAGARKPDVSALAASYERRGWNRRLAKPTLRRTVQAPNTIQSHDYCKPQ